MTTALGVAPVKSGDASVGVSPLTHRRIIDAQWSSTGVLTGLDAAGRTDMRYNVSAGVAVVARDDGADGCTIAYWAGGQTPEVKPGDPSNPRVDSIWVKANNPEHGDTDNQVVIGVTSGVASANPVAPDVTSGGLVIGTRLVPAGATSTSSTTQFWPQRHAIPYGASLGRLAYNVRNYEGPANVSDAGKDYYENSVQFYVPTRRLVEFRFSAIAASCRHDDPSKPTESATDMACWYVGVQLDGKDVPGGGGQFQVSRAWEPVQLNVLAVVDEGVHTARTRNHRVQWGENVYFICHTDSSQTYPGRTLEVWDRGVVAE